MKVTLQTLAAALAICATGYSQPKLEFDAAAIKPAAPQTGHFPAPAAAKGGPGTSDPAMYRCTNCNLAFLISAAFQLEKYQFPGQSALPGGTYDVTARVPEGTTPAQFAIMLQNLLTDRFGMTSHFDTKPVQGYELVVGKNGPKLKESVAPPSGVPEREAHVSGGGDWHGSGGAAGGHDAAPSRPGLMVFGGQAKYRGDHETTTDLARMISAQLMKPVDDHTGLKGTYDILLNWSDDGAHAATHAAGPGGGFGGDHGGERGGAAEPASGPTLIGALQAQLGLRLEPKKATANIFTVDHVEKAPTAN